MIAFAFAASALADTPVDVASLPAAVTATIARQWPTGRVVSAEKDGKELEVVVAVDARQIEVALTADGAWIETEEVVAVDTVPAAVRTAAASQGEVTRVEKQTAADGHVAYEIAVKSAGKSRELHFDAQGKAFTEDDEGDDDESTEDDD